MPDVKNQWVEAKNNHSESPKKRSFFWWEINEQTKDLLDFRYNTQEEIDKLNEEMTTTSDLDEMIRQSNNLDNKKEDENIDNEENKNEEYLKQKDEKEAESNLEQNLQSVDESLDNVWTNNTYDKKDEDKYDKPIEWEIVDNPDMDIDAASARVAETYYCHQWHKEDGTKTVKERSDDFLKMVDMLPFYGE